MFGIALWFPCMYGVSKLTGLPIGKIWKIPVMLYNISIASFYPYILVYSYLHRALYVQHWLVETGILEEGFS